MWHHVDQWHQTLVIFDDLDVLLVYQYLVIPRGIGSLIYRTMHVTQYCRALPGMAIARIALSWLPVNKQLAWTIASPTLGSSQWWSIESVMYVECEWYNMMDKSFKLWTTVSIVSTAVTLLSITCCWSHMAMVSRVERLIKWRKRGLGDDPTEHVRNII